MKYNMYCANRNFKHVSNVVEVTPLEVVIDIT